MHVWTSYTWPDSSSVDVHLDDEIEGFDPLRLADECAYARDLLRHVVADHEHDRAEHE